MIRLSLFGSCVLATLLASAGEKALSDWEFSRDGTTWKPVTVPHDWAIEGPFDLAHDRQTVRIVENGEEKATDKVGRTGSLPWIGTGEYRRTVAVPADAEWASLVFDGAMSEPEVFLNGTRIGGWKNGYTPFEVELPSTGGVVVVKLENPPLSSRWYPGAGLYRPVTLRWGKRVGVKTWGVDILTPDLETVVATAELRNPDNAQATVEFAVLDGNGTCVAKGASPLKVKNAHTWSPEDPYLYTLVTTVRVGGKVVDENVRKFGIRTLEYGPGFFKLNGQARKFQGVCLHHDLGPLGAAFSKDAFRRQVRLLKEMGCDSIRTSHNHPAPGQLDVCDEEGLMVVAESFDAWAEVKVKNGYNRFFRDWWKKDLARLVEYGRGHPSVVMWSIGNEISEQRHEKGSALYAEMQAYVHSCDRDKTRPVSAGASWMPNAIESGFIAAMDIPAVTYRLPFYEAMHAAAPRQGSVLGIETASTVSSRGEYHYPVAVTNYPHHANGQCSGYDTEYCCWSNLPDDDWAMQEDHPWTIGEFVWTGFDYLGEPTPYDDPGPSHSSYFGILDLAGLPKDRYHLYRSHWRKDAHTLHLVPHWTFPGREGQVTPVYCYTDFDEAELFVNGRSQGRRKKDKSSRLDRFRLRWNDVVYAPGELKVVAYDRDGKPARTETVRTAGPVASLKLEKRRFGNLLFVTVSAVDAKGTLVPDASDTVRVTAGEGLTFKAIANGDATSLEPFVKPEMKLFHGQLVAVFEGSGEAVRAEICRPLGSSEAEDPLLWVDGCAEIGLSDGVVTVSSTGEVSFVRLTWPKEAPRGTLVLNDAWERSYGDLEWRDLSETCFSPWYYLATVSNRTWGVGVETGPAAMCCWEVSARGTTLVLDLRAGGRPVRLGGRTLRACRIVRAASRPGESAWQFGRRFCRMMCPKPKLPKTPVFGYNDWYCAYGKNTATNFLADAAYIVDCTKGCAHQPYVVMDDGWQKNSPPVVHESGRGPWDGAGANFGMDMKTFCGRIAALGAKPGLWYRPLRAWDELPDDQRLQADRGYLDPSVPAVRARIVEDMARFRDWGFKLVKIDFLSFDLSQLWPCDPHPHPDRYIQDDRAWRDSSRTTAEVMLDLYRVMKDTAGDGVVIIGCNALNHLAAGVFELQRTGNDTSGRNWAWTKNHGVNTLAMRSIQDGAFFRIDADCVGLASEGAVPWSLNSQWMDLLGRSGTPFFVSWSRHLATPEVRAALCAAFRHAAADAGTIEPLDWMKTRTPTEWKTGEGVSTYRWSLAPVVASAASIGQPVPFGKLSDGRETHLCRLTGEGGLVLDVTDYGGRVVRVYAPDRYGNLADVTLGFNTAAEYEKNGFCVGTLIGRYGNRIADGRFALDGKTVELALTETTNGRHCNCHSGPKGWDDKIWTMQPLKEGTTVGLRLSIVSPDGDMGFPGTVRMTVTYRVTADNVWTIDYEATTDRTTVINPTHHSYWNLAGEGDVLKQELQIVADRYTQTTAGLIPTKDAPVAGTGFDFTTLRPIDARRAWMEGEASLKPMDNWYDHNFVLRGKLGELHDAALMRDPVSGRTMRIRTTEPCMQMYGAQNMDGTLAAKAAGRTLPQFAGVALETQHYPDSPNHPEFPSTVLKPGETFRSRTEYIFGVDK